MITRRGSKMTQKMSSIVIGMALIALLVLGACTQLQQPPQQQPTQQPTYIVGAYNEAKFDPVVAVSTKTFKSASELSSFIKDNANQQYYGGYGGIGMPLTSDVGMVKVSAGAESVQSAPSAGSQYSQTNNQVAGVDEADIIKTDGDYIYTISNNNVYIIKAYPGADAQVVATLKYQDSDLQSLFIQGKHLAVFGNYYNAGFFKETDFRPTSGLTFLNIYELSDPSAPKLVKEYKFEGNYFNARMKGDFAYFVVRSAPEDRPIPMPLIFEGIVNGGVPVGDEVVRSDTEDKPIPMPRMLDDFKRSSVPIGDIYYYNFPYRNPQFVTVHAIDLSAPDEPISSKTIAVEYSQNLYMSENNIYITYTEWVQEWELRQEISNTFLEGRISATDLAIIEKIKAADNDVLSQYEKQQKISNIYNSYFYLLPQKEQDELNDQIEGLLEAKLKEIGYLEYTVINKIAVNNGEIKVEGSGKVPGQIINQFSMDENGDNFRIATTLSQRWSRLAKQQTESTNNVYALDKDMKIVGMLEGLAPGEQIYSTRFIGSRLYMVTFRQVDPFFVIDLSNPREIKELGKLKLPGFSRYLHPYDADTIIGIGQESTEQGRVTGLKISLFDVSDVANPKEAAKFVTDERYAQSTALWEHKAFLFDKEKQLLVIPVYSNEFDSEFGKQQQGYNGAFVFSIASDSIKLRGLIDHSRNQTGQDYYYQPMVERSLWINELLYTKSPALLRINKIEDLGSVKNVQLQGTPTNFPVY